ncbi:50S ribosomal protein L10 [candidate division WOR-1 bacterium RIFOXYD2_FULL_36_8]|uniref:Large ribosomal subunit protein uL10 n=1 Tax=candidate division WOR-1 bacterium RIFOXYB2_FULL_36_35 TaxID=1802578 RepID=A0A1F4S534_UNCSA|nr:MAG: 50S ribosomal protein L10 [candidate division WOR-1 bacterium RIFOXYA2_FULL_36_21]OGC15538.1 MAG: 50S ribosomal protein L10 [candidate division WOR-1 bacterium RIFOXYB2_FULL_36_35]OGC21323.1 MAG: 50S ribosomal protein L10 [candidate division WOR-1 bacterium RIFOXYA12_FULL_36_13]OGC37644.1 MAG: 50S ribosomal protein L10 [candidate division WOR-1 bacterium RIFOXYD2_FULL_36_8]
MTVRTKHLKQQKVEKVSDIKERIASSNVIILTDYQGMTVKQLTELRKKLYQNDAEFTVVKNRYFIKALPEKLSSLEAKLKGTIATLFGSKDLISPVKTLMDFIGENEKPKIIAGVVEDEICDDNKIKTLSKLPGKKELLSKVVGGLKSPLYNVVSVMQGPIRKLVYAMDDLRKKKSEGGEK